MTDFIKAVEAPVNPNIPELRPGDAVSVHVRIKEGERERIQEFKGTIIRLRRMEKHHRDEADMLLETYKQALGI